MILQIFSIRDSLADTYGTPFFAPTAGLAQRSFATLVSDPQSQVYQNPQDFALYYLGDFETDSGIIMPREPLQIVSASSLKGAVTHGYSNQTKV